MIERAFGTYRAVARFLERRALARALRAVPRTLHFMGVVARSGEVSTSVPAPAMSIGFAAGVAMDEALLAMAMAPNRFPRRADYHRVGDEMADARQLYSKRGWLDHPETYHRTPPELEDQDLQWRGGWAHGISYEQLGFDSGFVPRLGEPAAERWMAYGPNAQAWATILRKKPLAPGPWIVGVHGFCMGYPFMDFAGLHAARLHRRLGFNLALPVLPLHGPRKVTKVSGEPFLSFDLMNTVHGLSQSIWDIRRLISWIRTQGATSIHLYGVSLGAYVVSLLAGIEEGIDGVMAGNPVVDFPRLFEAHSPRHIRARSIEHRILGGAAEDVFRVVTPLSFEALVPVQGRALFAGYGDRLTFPQQAQLLWEHWEQPPITWYAGNHVGYLWSRPVVQALEEWLSRSSGNPGDAEPAAPPVLLTGS